MNNQEILISKFGRLAPLKYIPGSRAVKPKFACKCDCGNECVVSKQNIVSGKTKSCGCLASEKLAERNINHGLRYTPEYSVWCGVKNRCTNPNSTGYEHYGGRGISVCDRWLNDFKSFILDMGNRPSDSHSIERIDNNGNYEPSNCKWATTLDQSTNKRIPKNNKSGVKGVTFSVHHNAWIAYWSNDGKQKKSHFSIDKHSDEEAFNLAVKKRKEMEVKNG